MTIRPLAVLLVTCATAAATASAQPLSVTPVFKAGDEFHLRVTHARENTSQPERNGTATTQVRVRVVSVSPEGTVVEWMPDSGSLDNPAVANDPVFRDAARALGAMTLRIALDSDGAVDRLLNEEEIAARLQAAVDVLTRDFDTKVPPERRAQLQALLKQVLSPGVLITSATRHADMYFAMGGMMLDPGEEAEAELDMPNPLGSGVLPAVFRVKAEPAGADAMTFTTSTDFEREGFVEMIKSLMAQAGAPPGEQELKALLEQVRLRDDARYLIDRATGLPREIIATREITMGPQRRTDRTEFRRIPAPGAP